MSIERFHVFAIRNQPADIYDTICISMAMVGAALNILKNIWSIKLDGCAKCKQERDG